MVPQRQVDQHTLSSALPADDCKAFSTFQTVVTVVLVLQEGCYSAFKVSESRLKH